MKSSTRSALALLAMMWAVLGADVADASGAGRLRSSLRNREPVDPVQDVSFAGAAESGAICDIVRDEEGTSYEKTELDESTMAADVQAGVISIGQVTMSNADGYQVVVSFDAADLAEYYFASGFSSEGTAIVTTPEGDVEIPVMIRGMIREREGVYTLFAHVRGYIVDDSVEGTTAYTVVKMRFFAEVEVPGDEVPDDSDDDSGVS